MTRTLILLTALAVLAVPTAGRAGEESTAGETSTAVAVSTAVEAHSLHLRLEKGDTYKFTTETERTITKWIDGNETEEVVTLALTQTVKVVSVKDDGAATIRVTYDRVAIKCKNDDGDYEFDSDNPPDEPDFVANLFSALVGQSLDVKVSAKGEIVDIKNDLAVNMALMGALQSDEEGDDGHRTITITMQGDAIGGITPLNEAMRLLHNKEALEEHLAFLAVVYADMPVAVDKTWDVSEKRTGRYPGTYDTTYKLVSAADAGAEIELAGTVKGDADAKNKGGIRMGIGSGMTGIEGTRKGTLEVDKDSGLVRAGTVSTSLKGSTMVFNPMVDPKNMTPTPTTVDAKTTIKGAKLVVRMEEVPADSAD